MSTSAQWRKLHKSVMTSQKLQQASDAAFRIWTYLLVSQDHDGRYPNEPLYLAVLGLPCGKAESAVRELIHELETLGIIAIEDGFIEIYRGAELNGIPKRKLSPRRNRDRSSTDRG